MAEIIPVACNEYAVVGESDGSNPHILAADAQTLPLSLLINAFSHGVIVEHVQLCQINDGFVQVSAGCGARITSRRLADLRQAPAQLLFSGNDRDRQSVGSNLSQALTYLRMAAEMQAQMIRIQHVQGHDADSSGSSCWR